MTNDADLLVSTYTTTLAFLKINWKQILGRPTVTLVATHNHLGTPLSETLAFHPTENSSNIA